MMNKKNTISAKKLNKETLVQTLYMDDYFSEGLPHTSKPVKFGKFLKEIAHDLEVDQSENDVLFAELDGEKLNLVEEYYQMSGDGMENFALITIVDGVVKVVQA